MNRLEFIKKFSLLSTALASIPALYAQEKSHIDIPGLIKDPNGIIDLTKGFYVLKVKTESETKSIHVIKE